MNESHIVSYLRRFYHVNTDAGEFRHKGGRKGGKKEGTIAGYINLDGYRVLQLRGKNYYAHRLVWLVVHGRWPVNMLDHINHRRDDNRLANLREADNSLNQLNRAPSPDRVPGVSVDRINRRFVAYIQPAGKKRVNLGGFKSYGAACRQRIRAEVEYGNVT